jgi:hypothetical protein
LRVLVNVQVTVSPEETLIVAVRVSRFSVESASSQSSAVRSYLSAGAPVPSVTE